MTDLSNLPPDIAAQMENKQSNANLSPDKHYMALPLTAADAEHSLRGLVPLEKMQDAFDEVRRDAAERGVSYENLIRAIAGGIAPRFQDRACDLLEAGISPRHLTADEDGEAVVIGGAMAAEALIPFDPEGERAAMALAQTTALRMQSQAATRH